jgi:hypothetical protein
VATIATILALGLLLVVLARRERAVFYPLMVAFGLRIFASVVNLYVIEFPAHSGGDAITFENRAWTLANLQWEAFIDALQIGDPYFTYGWIVGLIYRIVGRVILVPHVLNAFLGALVVYYVFKTTRILWGETAAIRAMWVAALFPPFLHYHSVLLREVWVALGFTLSIYFFAKYLYKDRSLYNALLSLVSMGGATIFHGGMIAGVLGLLLYFFWRFIQLWRDLTLRAIGAPRMEFLRSTLLIGIVLPLLVYGIVTGMDVNKVGDLRGLIQPETFTERATQVAQSRMSGGARYPELLNLRGAEDIVVKTVPRSIYLLFSPFPWDVRKAVHAVAMIDSLIYMLMFYHIFRKWDLVGARRLGVMMVVLVPIIMAFSIGSSNFGAAMRHRAKVASLIICMFPVFPGVRIDK